MALKTYIGARYAPKFMGKWDASTAYEPLSVVYWNNNSYVSKGVVPAGTPVTVEEPDGEVVTNSAYWILSSEWNAQVSEYQKTVEQYRDEAVKQTEATNKYKQDTDNFFSVTMHSYNTEEEMKIDSTVKVGYTLLTCGKKTIGDGGGRYYKVVEETSSDAVALAGGLWAKPFNITLPEEDWTELALELNDSDQIVVQNMVSGGRYITKSEIGLQADGKQCVVSIPNANVLNNVQLLLLFTVVPYHTYELQFSPQSGRVKIYSNTSSLVMRVKIDKGKLTVSGNDISGYLTTADKQSLTTEIEKRVLNSDFDSYKNTNNAAVASKASNLEFQKYTKASNSNVGINYTRNQLTVSLYGMSISDIHFQNVTATFNPAPSSATLSTTARVTITTSFKDQAIYSGFIHFKAATSNLTLTNKKAAVVMNNSYNALDLDFAKDHKIGYIYINTTGNAAAMLFEADDEFVMENALDDYKDSVNTRFNNKLDSSTFESYKTSNDANVANKVDYSFYKDPGQGSTAISSYDTTLNVANSAINLNTSAAQNSPVVFVEYACSDGESAQVKAINKQIKTLCAGTYKHQTLYIMFSGGGWVSSNLGVTFDLGQSVICNTNIPAPPESTGRLIFKIDAYNFNGTLFATMSTNFSDTTHVG